jgi:diacylglycerol kinase (ATP)
MHMYRTLVQQRAQERGADYIETSQPAEARDLARQAALAGRSVIVVGGDGSLHEVINGLLTVERRVPLGIIAAGSGNDFAWNMLKLPRDPEAMVARAFDGQPVAVDAGCVNGRYFANGFSIGLDADIGALANRMKNVPLVRGAALYNVAAVRQLLFHYHRCPWLTYRLDDGEEIAELRYVLIAVTNGPAYGAGFFINPQADPFDGLLELCIVAHTSRWRILQLLPRVKQGKHGNVPEVSFHRAKKVVFKSRYPVTLQADGETSTETYVEARVLPGALLVRV